MLSLSIEPVFGVLACVGVRDVKGCCVPPFAFPAHRQSRTDYATVQTDLSLHWVKM